MSDKNNKVKISVIIVAKNEEEKLPDCLKSIKWADEIVVIDNDSMDKTVEIAKRFGARVFSASDTLTLKYADLRNMGLEKAIGKWVFYIDADERVTPELKDEINEILTSSFDKPRTSQNDRNVDGDGRYNAYAIPRRNVILGREMKHGGWWPDYVKRLFLRKSLKKWTGDVHEEPVYEGEMGHLENHLIHIKHNKLEGMVEKTNKWSEIEAKLMFDANHPRMNIVRFFTAMAREFWLRMIKHKAFLDGGEGTVYALYQVWSKFISYAKLWEMQINDSNDANNTNATNEYE